MKIAAFLIIIKKRKKMSEEKKRKKVVSRPAQQEAPPPEDDLDLDDQNAYVIKRPPWILRIDGLDVDVPLTGLKLPMFTTGVADRGDMTIETINIPEIALNSYFRIWLMAPLPRRVKLDILDAMGSKVESWSMSAGPGAMGFSELDIQDDAPWSTQIAFSVTDINIAPQKKS